MSKSRYNIQRAVQAVLDSSFRQYCLCNHQEQAFETILKVFDFEQFCVNDTSSGFAPLEDFIDRCTYGTDNDVLSSINSLLDKKVHEIGVRTKLSKLLLEMRRQVLPSLVNNASELTSALSTMFDDNSNHLVDNLLSKLQQGDINNEQYFTQLNELAAKGLIDVNVHYYATERVLHDSGYRGAFSNTFGDIKFQSSKCSAEMSDRFDTNEFVYSLETLDGIPRLGYHSLDGTNCVFGFDKEEHLYETKSKSLARPCISTDQLWWERQSGSGLLCSELIDIDYDRDNNNDIGCMNMEESDDDGFTFLDQQEDIGDRYASSNKTNAPVLLIGDILTYSEGSVEVDMVIAVDALPMANGHLSGSLFEVAILLKGRIIHVHSISNGKKAENTIEDGRSEIARQDDINPSPNCSGFEENNLAAVQYSFETQDVIVVAQCSPLQCTISSVIPLIDVLEADQIPIRVGFVRIENSQRCCLLVNGSHGLLVVIKISNNDSMTRSSNNEKQHLSSKITIHYLVQDSFQPTQLSWNSFPTKDELLDWNNKSNHHHDVGHESSAAIVSVLTTSHQDVLLSLDNLGVLCIWQAKISELNNHDSKYEIVGRFSLLRGSRPTSIFLTPSETHVLVSYRDRLLMFEINIPQDICGNSKFKSCSFREKAQLDYLQDTIAHYHVQFLDQQLRIWRLSSNDTKQDSPSTLSTWIHSNIDSFTSRLTSHSYNPTVHWGCNKTGERSNIKNQRWKAPTINTDVTKVGAGKEGFPICSEVDQRIGSTATNASYMLHTNTTSELKLHNGFVKIDDVFSPVFSQLTQCPAFEAVIDKNFHSCCTPIQTTAEMESTKYLCPAHNLSMSRMMSFRLEHLSGCNIRKTRNDILQRASALCKAIHRDSSLLRSIFEHDQSPSFRRVAPIIATICACLTPPPLALLCAALEISDLLLLELLEKTGLSELFVVRDDTPDNQALDSVKLHIPVNCREHTQSTLRWMCSREPSRVGREFWIDVSMGHNFLCALFLKTCANKSVAVDPAWQSYLQTYGPLHLRNSSRALSTLTSQVRKIDETANLKSLLPRQIGYISGLQEIYARRVGLCGNIPREIGRLSQLRVLSMGNNQLSGELPRTLANLKQLQRIVLHQNNLCGKIPDELGRLGCIVNVAGNPRLEYGTDVPSYEREALMRIFQATKGLQQWNTNVNWGSDQPVSKWYKVKLIVLNSSNVLRFIL
jgi:hypothetical protein